MPNGALPQYLKRQRPEADERLRFMYEIALGMEYLHSREVLHGDMKAANVLVDGQGICLIADFGQSDVRNQVLQLSGQAPPRTSCPCAWSNLLADFDIQMGLFAGLLRRSSTGKGNSVHQLTLTHLLSAVLR